MQVKRTASLWARKIKIKILVTFKLSALHAKESRFALEMERDDLVLNSCAERE